MAKPIRNVTHSQLSKSISRIVTEPDPHHHHPTRHPSNHSHTVPEGLNNNFKFHNTFIHPHRKKQEASHPETTNHFFSKCKPAITKPAIIPEKAEGRRGGRWRRRAWRKRGPSCRPTRRLGEEEKWSSSASNLGWTLSASSFSQTNTLTGILPTLLSKSWELMKTLWSLRGCCLAMCFVCTEACSCSEWVSILWSKNWPTTMGSSGKQCGKSTQRSSSTAHQAASKQWSETLRGKILWNSWNWQLSWKGSSSSLKKIKS